MASEETITVKLYRWHDCGSWDFNYPPESADYQLPRALKNNYEATRSAYHAAAKAIQEWKDAQDAQRKDKATNASSNGD